MEVKFVRSKAGTIIWGIVSIVLGVLLFLNPINALQTLTVAVGWVLAIAGIVSIISAFTSHSAIMSSLDLYNGVLSLLFGIIMLASPGLFVGWIFILLGLYIVFSSFSGLMGSNAARAIGLQGSGAGIFASILGIILGFLVIGAPWATAGVTMLICGVALVYNGVLTFIAGIKMPSEKKDE